MIKTKLQIFFALLNVTEPRLNYCALSERHMLCKSELYKQQTCGSLRKIPLEKDDRNELLKTFDKLRKDALLDADTIQKEMDDAKRKTVVNIGKLEWHDELQKAAEAIQCRCPITPVAPESIVFLDKGTNTRMQAKQITLNRFSKKELFHEFDLAVKKEDKSVRTDNIKSNLPLTTFSILTHSEAKFIGCARSIPVDNGQRPDIFIEHCLVMPSESTNYSLHLEWKPCSTCPKENNCDSKVINNSRVSNRIREIREAPLISNKSPILDTSVNTSGDKEVCKDNNPFYLKKREREELLDILNTFRLEMATGKSKILLKDEETIPETANMMELEWDDDLEELAAITLHSCKPSSPFQFQMSFGKMLEELVSPDTVHHAIENTNNPYLREAYTKIIADKALNFDNKNLNAYSWNDSYDAFTIIAFAKARYVGCARISPIQFDNKIFKFGDLCVFLPSEYKADSPLSPEQMNKSGVHRPEQNTSNLFMQGKPCSQCPLGSECSAKFVGLCKVNTKYYGGLEIPKDYCQLNTTHVFCNKTIWGDRKSCTGFSHWDMNGKRMQAILDTHNDLRRQLATGTSKLKENLEKAADMNKMEWDYELQRAAEIIIYEDCENRTSYGISFYKNTYKFRVGKTGELRPSAFLIYIGDKGYSEMLVTFLTNDAINFDWKKIQNYTPTEGDGYIFNVLKSDLRFIGCASLRSNLFATMVNAMDLDKYFCIVAPHEERKSIQLYSVGDPCTKCAIGFVCNDGLCQWSSKGGLERPDTYCAINSIHILCQEWDSQNERGDKKACTNMKRLPMTDKEANERLSIFSQIRKCLTKNSTCDIDHLEWNKDLQRAAQALLYSCIPEDEIKPEMLQFGRVGEFQAVKIFMHHSENNSEESLKRAFRGYETFDAFTSLAAKPMGCARIAPLDSLNEVTEVCVLLLMGQANEDGNCSSCHDESSCNETLDFCVEEKMTTYLRPSTTILTTTQMLSTLIAETTITPIITTMTGTSPGTTFPETIIPTMESTSTTATTITTTTTTTTETTITTTTASPVVILMQGEIFEPEDTILDQGLVLLPGQPSMPPKNMTESVKVGASTSRSQKIYASSFAGLLIPIFCLIAC